MYGLGPNPCIFCFLSKNFQLELGFFGSGLYGVGIGKLSSSRDILTSWAMDLVCSRQIGKKDMIVTAK